MSDALLFECSFLTHAFVLGFFGGGCHHVLRIVQDFFSLPDFWVGFTDTIFAAWFTARFAILLYQWCYGIVRGCAAFAVIFGFFIWQVGPGRLLKVVCGKALQRFCKKEKKKGIAKN